MRVKKEKTPEKVLERVIFYLFLALGLCWVHYEFILLNSAIQRREVYFLWFDYIFMLFSFGAMVWLSLIYYAVHKKTKRFAWRYLAVMAFFILWPVIHVWSSGAG